MSWHAWMILSLAWGASPFLVSAMAVKNGHRGSALDVNMSTLGVSAHKTDCGTCDIFRRDDRALYDQCNVWGDPHVTSRFGGLKGKDYQGGGGVQNVTRTRDQCNQLEMQAFHCQYGKSLNSVMLGALVKITAGGTDVKIYIKPQDGVLVVDVLPVDVVTVAVIVGNDGKSVAIASPDGCLYVYIDLKTISVTPKYIMNIKSRVLNGLPIIGDDGGYCGAEQPTNAFVTDNSAWLFTETQVQELCDLCVAGGAGVPPSCPGAPPPVAKGLPRCSFADAILARDETNVRTDCTGTVQERAESGDQPTTANFLPLEVPEENECVFGHNNVGLLPLQSCDRLCALVAPGSFCRFTLFGDETCNQGNSFALSFGNFCATVGNKGACHCGNISESLQQQEGPTVNQLLDLTGVADENKTNELNNVVAKCTGVQTGSATYPRANPNDPSEEELILEGCIKDILALGALADHISADVERVLEITQDFDPNLPSGGDIGTPCPRDTPLDSACTCTTGVVCSEGQSCDGAGCLDRDCRAFRAFSCPSGRVPLQPFVFPYVNCTAGACNVDTCCITTCGSTGFAVCNQEGFTVDEVQAGTFCTSGTCDPGTCCSRTCEGFDDCAGALVGNPRSVTCGGGGTPCSDACCVPTCGSTEFAVCKQEGFVADPNQSSAPCDSGTCDLGTCCQPTCASHDCTTIGFVLNEKAKTDICTGSQCGDSQCCEPTCASVICEPNFMKNKDKFSATCPNGQCDNAFCCEPTCASFKDCSQKGFVLNVSKNDVVCSDGICNDAKCCQPTCLSYERCKQQGFVKDSGKDSKKCLPGGCDDITCCEATCATYKHCKERRAELDPKKTDFVCGLTADKCNDDLCCEKRGQLRRSERRERRDGRRNAQLIDTEELAFLQESGFVDEDEEEESEEL